MRSQKELLFRLRQELANLGLLVAPPSWEAALAGPFPQLPDPAAVAASLRIENPAHVQQVEQHAEELLQHRFRLLGLEPVQLEDAIRWRRDFLHGQETGLAYFRRIPYLDFHQVGDHKLIWELNRHQHLVVLAQAFLLTGRQDFLEEIPQQLDHWMQENPVQRGINWASALEVAFRALSWVLVLHLVGAQLPEDFRRRLVRSLNHHGLHLEKNLSFYFSPNTHLLGEAVVLDALGTLLPQMPHAGTWRTLGAATVQEQMRRQVRDDGSHFEQSSYYHVYAVDFFELHALLHPDTPAWYRSKLGKMLEFRDSLISSQGLLPLIGDDDGGRLFHPYGDRRRFGVAVREEMAWWMVPSAPVPPEGSCWFADAGLAVLRAGGAQVIVDAGGFGTGSAGHSHADTLSVVAFRNGQELLIDAGTFTYISDPEARQQFRGTASHNTLYIDSLEQADPQGPFRWNNPPIVELLYWDSSASVDILDAACKYRGFSHRRSVVFQKPDLLVVLDRVSGPEGRHRVEQRWLTPQEVSGEFLETVPEARQEPAERSCALGSRQQARRWVARYEGELPTTMVAVLRLGLASKKMPPARVQTAERTTVVELEGGRIRFPHEGPPLVEIGKM
ncbi:MAG: alginate lyase family protein [Bryobacteraceae bacterium]